MSIERHAQHDALITAANSPNRFSAAKEPGAAARCKQKIGILQRLS
jgi:hypothetical protein